MKWIWVKRDSLLLIISAIAAITLPSFSSETEKPCRIVVNVAQHDGPASGRIYLAREHVKNELGIEKREWRDVDNWSIDGTRTISVAPGTYRFGFMKNGTYQYSGEFTLDGADTRRFDFDVATIQVAARKYDGPASGRIYLAREHVKNELGIEKREWRDVDNWSIDGTGTISVAPGTYRFGFMKNGTYQYSGEFTLDGTDTRRFDFDVATIQVAARKYDGPASGRIYLAREHVNNELGIEKREWRDVDNWSIDGTRTISVAPGTYRFGFMKNGTHQFSGEFTLSNVSVKQFRLFVSIVQVVGKSGDRFVDGRIDVYREDGEDWNRIDNWSTRQGTSVIDLQPGTYKLMGRFGEKRIESEPFSLLYLDAVRMTFDVNSNSTYLSRLNPRIKPEDLPFIVMQEKDRKGIGNSGGFIDFMSRAREESGNREALGDKAIEALIEATTPEADEETRVIQRSAIRCLFSPTEGSSEKSFSEMQEGIRKIFE